MDCLWKFTILYCHNRSHVHYVYTFAKNKIIAYKNIWLWGVVILHSKNRLQNVINILLSYIFSNILFLFRSNLQVKYPWYGTFNNPYKFLSHDNVTLCIWECSKEKLSRLLTVQNPVKVLLETSIILSISISKIETYTRMHPSTATLFNCGLANFKFFTLRNLRLK